MSATELDDLNAARLALVRQRNAIAKRMGAIALAPVSMAEDLTRILLAIEAVDRALVDAGQPYMPADV
ncbi:hypothetical protein [Methylorubrum extorquens]|uniref:Uncharacterized protein n=2 Tax=Methylorubrum extorquens TaxID=408 RepID=B7KY07_METC4|nr:MULTISPECIES: hypothetical protein [Methylobacteriaceae]ACK81170.1 conserved hypothetical protein [Methylorubrum extorquens CM4]KQO96091.1 hypothetical protein ASF33_07485 [Methylobacterium sp. Leaf92]KQQ06817.1 hypothetical protein ASF56_07440 [Methylobacterium sp. Leaf122]WHQ68366.1 hypothetical protein KEC54_18500 [Methylorubrum extorquens]